MDWMHFLQLALQFDQHLGSLVAQHGATVYFMLFAIVFCEIALLPLFFLPGDPLLFLCGAVCATGGIRLGIVLPLLFVATVAGSLVSYRIGRAVGQRAFAGDFRWLNRHALQRSHTFYETHGGVTFLVSPFIAVVRTFAPFIGGMAAMGFRRFFAAVCGGAALWVGSLVVGGYFFGNVPLIRDHMGSLILVGIGAGVGGLIAGTLRRIWRARRPAGT